MQCGCNLINRNYVLLANVLLTSQQQQTATLRLAAILPPRVSLASAAPPVSPTKN